VPRPPHEVLGVPADAPPAEMRTAYRRRARDLAELYNQEHPQYSQDQYLAAITAAADQGCRGEL
jgi:hypothetical protein